MKAQTTSRQSHRYYPCNCEAGEHPSLTTLLDVIGNPALIGWSAKHGTNKLNLYAKAVEKLSPEAHRHAAEIAQLEWAKKETTDFWKSGRESAKDATDHGTMAHGWIEPHLHGTDISLESLTPEARNAVNAYLAWEKDHHIKLIDTEKTLYNCKLGYAGTCDAILEIDGVLTLVDWKTSNAIYSNYIIQCWGYALASESRDADLLYKQVAIGRFSKTGETEFKVYKRTSFPGIETAREVLTACAAIFKFQREYDLKFPWRKNGN